MNLNTLQILPIQTQIHEYWRRFHAEQLITDTRDPRLSREYDSTEHDAPDTDRSAVTPQRVSSVV